jgi:hypothetical protein
MINYTKIALIYQIIFYENCIVIYLTHLGLLISRLLSYTN